MARWLIGNYPAFCKFSLSLLLFLRIGAACVFEMLAFHYYYFSLLLNSLYFSFFVEFVFFSIPYSKLSYIFFLLSLSLHHSIVWVSGMIRKSSNFFFFSLASASCNTRFTFFLYKHQSLFLFFLILGHIITGHLDVVYVVGSGD